MRQHLSGMILTIEFTEEFNMGNINILSADSVSNRYRQKTVTKNRFDRTQSQELQIGSRILKISDYLSDNTVVFAQSCMLNAYTLPFIRV